MYLLFAPALTAVVLIAGIFISDNLSLKGKN